MAALPTLPFHIYRQKSQKNILLVFAIVWLLSTLLSSLFLVRIAYSCSPTRLLCSYMAGMLFWFMVIPLISSVLARTKQWSIISGFGILLIVANQLFVYEIVQQTYWLLWAYSEPNPCWVNEVITNNILVNILFYGMVVHTNWNTTPETKSLSQLMIKDGNTISRVEVASIRFIKVEQNCIHIHTVDRKFVMYSSLVKFSEQLPPQLFARIHRSVIVNQAKIQQVRNLPVGDAEVILECGTVLKCSRNFKRNLERYLG